MIYFRHIAMHGLLGMLFGTASLAADRPNIVLLMGDDHGWDETGYNGHPYLKTPVLDSMASRGIRLDRFYAAHPSCSPTRGSVLTGRHPNRYGTFRPGFSIRPEEITIAQLLSDAGYDCAHFGKWHLGPVKAESPTNPGAMGFHQWLSHDNFFEIDPVLSRNGGPPERFSGEGSDVVVRAAIDYLSTTPRDRPFFVVIWFGSPHEPYSGLPQDLATYDHVPQNFVDQRVRLTSNKTGLQVVRPLGDVLRERYAEITAMDRSIGKLRDWLNDSGVLGDTLLWYCGDNGSHIDGSVTSQHRGHKGTVYEGGLRVPCVIEWDGFPMSRVVSANSVTSDILPTVCELVGIPLPDRPIDGESLVAVLRSKKHRRSESIYFWDFRPHEGSLGLTTPYIEPSLQVGTTPLVKQMNGGYTRSFQNVRIRTSDGVFLSGPRAVLDGEYKLVLEGGSDPRAVELFDLHRDPYEQNSIAAEMPERVARLRTCLQRWQESVVSSLAEDDYQ